MSKLNQFTSAFVWIGGALFVASLAVCAHAFVVTWAEPRPFVGTVTTVAANVTLFALFAFHHSWFARDRVKAALARRGVPEHLLRSTYVWIASVLLACVIWLWRPLGGTAYSVSGWLQTLLTLAQVAGIALIASAVRAISALELAGIRPSGTTDGLQIHGPYRLVRHPLYLGWTLAVFAATPMTGDRLAFAALSTAYLIIAVVWEEEALTRAFGDEYRRYKRQVRWRMLPYLY